MIYQTKFAYPITIAPALMAGLINNLAQRSILTTKFDALKLFWLADALDTQAHCLAVGFDVVLDIPEKGVRQCATLRQCISWIDKERTFECLEYSRVNRRKNRLARFIE